LNGVGEILWVPETRSRHLGWSLMLRACWVTHSPVGLVVMPATGARRLSSSTKNSTYKQRRNTVSTVKKS